MATDLGVDISCVDDIDPMFALVSGNTTTRQRLARRFRTMPGQIQDSETFGLDLRQFLSAGLPLEKIAEIRQLVLAQCKHDETVSGISVTADFNLSTKRLRVVVLATGPEGPFSLVLEATKTTVQILEGATR